MGGAVKRKGDRLNNLGFQPPTKKLVGFGLRSMKWPDERHSHVNYELNFLFVFNDKRSFFQSDNQFENNLHFVNASVFV